MTPDRDKNDSDFWYPRAVPTAVCGRCKRWIPAMDASPCPACDGPLCWKCFDEFGDCGHASKAKRIVREYAIRPVRPEY